MDQEARKECLDALENLERERQARLDELDRFENRVKKERGDLQGQLKESDKRLREILDALESGSFQGSFTWEEAEDKAAEEVPEDEREPEDIIEGEVIDAEMPEEPEPANPMLESFADSTKADQADLAGDIKRLRKTLKEKGFDIPEKTLSRFSIETRLEIVRGMENGSYPPALMEFKKRPEVLNEA